MKNILSGKLAFRTATAADLPRLTEIYNQAIATGRCTGDIKMLTTQQRQKWFAEHSLAKRTPIYVAILGNMVVGYAAIEPYRSGRAAFKKTCVISYYLDFRLHGKGIGKRLAKYIVGKASQLGYTSLVAIVLDCNKPSIGLLESMGFKRWGTLPDVAMIRGVLHSHIYFGLKIFEVTL